MLPTDSNIDFRAITAAREFALQFLYQCEAEKLYYFSASKRDAFIRDFSVPTPVVPFFSSMSEGVLEKKDDIDPLIAQFSKNWKISRMNLIDLLILRLGIWEGLRGETPPKVIINEAVKLAKKYGTEKSASFVNGVLDQVVKTLEKKD